jgi:SAM-dependent methyltransferase
MGDDVLCYELRGTIIRRRCLGRFIAFADVLSTQEPDDYSEAGKKSTVTTTWTITFRKDDLETDSFPAKKTALPFGGQCHAKLIRRTPEGEWLVKSWELTNNPRCEAIEHARLDGGGISSSHYLRERRKAFEATLLNARPISREEPSPVVVAVRSGNSFCSSPPSTTNKKRPAIDEDDTASSQQQHPPTSGNAHKVFAAWLVDHLLLKGVEKTNYVLDVGGGKGRLSLELSHLAAAKCTVVDPVRRKLPLQQIKQLVKQGKPVPDFVASYFANAYYDGLPVEVGANTPVWATESAKLASTHTCLVGLHPDQCTEDIVDAALAHGKPFAVVPCCVYPDLFAKRKLKKDGRDVRSYDDFLAYLMEKDDRIKQIALPFAGKNICIYRTIITVG